MGVINKLPTELHLHILSYLDLPSQASAADVCTFWRSVMFLPQLRNDRYSLCTGRKPVLGLLKAGEHKDKASDHPDVEVSGDETDAIGIHHLLWSEAAKGVTEGGDRVLPQAGLQLLGGRSGRNGASIRPLSLPPRPRGWCCAGENLPPRETSTLNQVYRIPPYKGSKTYLAALLSPKTMQPESYQIWTKKCQLPPRCCCAPFTDLFHRVDLPNNHTFLHEPVFNSESTAPGAVDVYFVICCGIETTYMGRVKQRPPCRPYTVPKNRLDAYKIVISPSTTVHQLVVAAWERFTAEYERYIKPSELINVRFSLSMEAWGRGDGADPALFMDIQSRGNSVDTGELLTFGSVDFRY
ncbi:hypothetical protein TWF481_004945 [Arthrobotrys musiformis]|uniref:F-box domain-containing protein n=1 Tax=Arthrobotrys musiformis TaxID=47236 RepID=A0AAV9WL21_9PEZI